MYWTDQATPFVRSNKAYKPEAKLIHTGQIEKFLCEEQGLTTNKKKEIQGKRRSMREKYKSNQVIVSRYWEVFDKQ